MRNQDNVTFGAAAELSARIFNGLLEEDEGTVLVGTSQIQRFNEDAERVFYVVVNLSANTIFASFDNQVSSSRGIILSANGGFLSLNAKDDFTLVARPLHVVSELAGSTLYFFSQRRYKSFPVKSQHQSVDGVL